MVLNNKKKNIYRKYFNILMLYIILLNSALAMPEPNSGKFIIIIIIFTYILLLIGSDVVSMRSKAYK